MKNQINTEVILKLQCLGEDIKNNYIRILNHLNNTLIKKIKTTKLSFYQYLMNLFILNTL